MLQQVDPDPVCDPSAPRYGVRNMKIDEETTFSMRVSWQPVDPGKIRHYRLSYVSAKGDRAEEMVRQTERNVAYVLLIHPQQLCTCSDNTSPLV